jgi:hypothetical protein
MDLMAGEDVMYVEVETQEVFVNSRVPCDHGYHRLNAAIHCLQGPFWGEISLEAIVGRYHSTSNHFWKS